MINYTQIESCDKCRIRCNQKPLLQKKTTSNIIWVGLSAVSAKNIFEEEPLSQYTRSGALIDEIEKLNTSKQYYRTNLVKCLPLDDFDKIRYPNTEEIDNCINYLEMEIKVLKPDKVFLLGKMVATRVLNKFLGAKYSTLNKKFKYEEYEGFENTKLIPIHHPSYMLIYKRKLILDYKKQLAKKIASS